VQHVTENTLPSLSLAFINRKSEMSAPIMKKDFVRIFLPWRNAAVGSGMRPWWLTTAGSLKEKTQI
jgi:hypothetical protein